MGEPVVVLTPDRGGDEQVERGDRGPPRHLIADGQPLGMLVEHRIDDMDECLVGGQETMPAR